MKHLWFCFIRGINNFGGSPVPSMSHLADVCQDAFRDKGIPIELLDWYGPTGNLALVADGLPKATIQSTLVSIIEKPCALVSLDQLAAATAALKGWPTPQNESGVRWTQGLAFRCEGPVHSATIRDSDLGTFLHIDSDMVGVYRKDIVGSDGNLDKKDRRGGWGAMSTLIGSDLGGLWTARSFSTVYGLVQSAAREISKLGAVSSQGEAVQT